MRYLLLAPVIIAACLLVLSGCMTTWQNIRPEMNLSGSEHLTYADCNARSIDAGYSVDVARSPVFASCMTARGFVRQ